MTDQTFATACPGGITNFNGVTHFGVAFDSDSTTIQKGVYSWGQPEKNYPEVLNYDYPVSSGTRTGTGLDIGLVKAFGNELFVGWKDSSTYGVDLIDDDNNPFATATLESLVFDERQPSKLKRALTLVATHEGLATGDSATVKYDIDRSGSFTSGTANTTADSKETRLVIDSDFKEIQIGLDLAATTGGPVITSFFLEYDDASQDAYI